MTTNKPSSRILNSKLLGFPGSKQSPQVAGFKRIAVRAWLGGITAIPLALWGVSANAYTASPSESSTPDIMAVAAGGIGTGGFVAGGESLYSSEPTYGMFYQPDSTYTDQVVTSGTATATDNTSGAFQASPSSPIYNYSTTATATAALGTIHLDASSTGPNSVLFPTGAAQGGWTTDLTISAPGNLQIPGSSAAIAITNGVTTGTLEFLVHVDGTLTENGPGGRPGFWVTPYANGNLIGPDSIFQANNPNPIIGSASSAGFETREWWLPADPSNTNLSLVVNQDILFTTTFTFGQQFSLGLYADAIGANGSYGNTFIPNISTSDFASTITWAGIQGISVDGSNLITSGYSVTSTSGVNWNQSMVTTPIPAAIWLVGSALLGLVGLGRRCRLP